MGLAWLQEVRRDMGRAGGSRTLFQGLRCFSAHKAAGRGGGGGAAHLLLSHFQGQA